MAQATLEAAPAPPLAMARRYDIDWLRVLAMLGVFFFHNARFFDELPWHVKDAQHSVWPLVFVGFLNCFQMPLLMLVSGAGSWFALQSRGAGQYLLDRVKRLLIPLYTVGLLLLIPPQYYWEITTNAAFHGSFGEAMRRFLGTFNFRPGLEFLRFWPGHLWFLRDLFLISLLTLPLLLFLKSPSGRRTLAALANLCDRPAGVLLFLLPIALADVGLRFILPMDHPLIWFLYLMTFFLIGYCLMADTRFNHAIQRHLAISAVLAFALFAAIGGWVFLFHYQPWAARKLSPAYIAFHLISSINAWAWIILILALAGRFLNFTNRFLTRANEAVLPFYILHQTIILAVGFIVVPWNLGIPAKYLIITTTSFALILLTYTLLIRRLNPARFLFGMRMSRAASAPGSTDVLSACAERLSRRRTPAAMLRQARGR